MSKYRVITLTKHYIDSAVSKGDELEQLLNAGWTISQTDNCAGGDLGGFMVYILAAPTPDTNNTKEE